MTDSKETKRVRTWWILDHIKDGAAQAFEDPRKSPMIKEYMTQVIALEDILPALRALGKISQLESMPLPDQDTVIKKHNVMASFAREALEPLAHLLKEYTDEMNRIERFEKLKPYLGV